MMSEIVKWLSVAWIAFGALLTIAGTGKPGRLTPGGAVVCTIFSAAWITAIVIWWQP